MWLRVVFRPKSLGLYRPTTHVITATFLRFFENRKNVTFYVFLLCFTCFLEVWNIPLIYTAKVLRNIVAYFSYSTYPTVTLLTLKELDFCTFLPDFCRRGKTGVNIWPRLILEPLVCVHMHAELTHIRLRHAVTYDKHDRKLKAKIKFHKATKLTHKQTTLS